MLTGFILLSYKITSVSAFSIQLLRKTLHPQKPDFRNFSTGAMTAASDNVTSSMSHFRNKRNMLIRTYKSVVPDAKASVVLIHGNCSHFRAEFTAYNMKWHMEKHAIGTPEVEDIVTNELMAVYPKNAGSKTTTGETRFPDAFTLDGRSFFDISPRFVYEGSFIEKLNLLGFNVYGLDHQSNGLSEGLNGKRNYFTNLEDIVEDVIQFIGIVKRNMFDEAGEKYDKEAIGAESVIGKVYLAGISMGGNIVLRVAQKTSIYKNGNQNFVDGLIAFAPMTDLSSYTDGVGKKIQLSISKAISMAYPSCTLGLAADNVPKSFNRFLRMNVCSPALKTLIMFRIHTTSGMYSAMLLF